MIITITLHCSGRDLYGCTAAISTGYEPDAAWSTRIQSAAQANGWTTRPVQHGEDVSPEAYCPTCTDRILTRAAEALDLAPADVLVDMLALVCVTVDADTVRSWTPEQRQEVERWAGLTHLSASDNPVKVPPRPEFLP